MKSVRFFTPHVATYLLKSGCFSCNISQIALCSNANSVCINSNPNHQFWLNPVKGKLFASLGRYSVCPSSRIFSFPSTAPIRSVIVVASSLPYNCEASHHAVLIFLYAGQESSSVDNGAAGFVRGIFMCPEGQVSSGRRGISMSSVPGSYFFRQPPFSSV